MSTQRIFTCQDGLKLASQHYANAGASATDSGSGKKFLLLHGWLDNCRTFWKLAPKLPGEAVALDMPGHGLSGHKSRDGPTAMLAEGAYYVHEVLKQLEWSPEETVLIGHSMGAGISLVYTATFPEQVSKLVLLEGVGPMPRDGKEKVLKGLRGHIEKRYKGNVDKDKPPRVYPSLEVAIQTRVKTASMAPGNQSISEEAATELVEYATFPSGDEGGVRFRHDPRLHYPSMQSFTADQVAGLQESIQCPLCLLVAEDGWPFDSKRGQESIDRLAPKHFAKLPGSHHFHADPETADGVTAEILKFLDME